MLVSSCIVVKGVDNGRSTVNGGKTNLLVIINFALPVSETSLSDSSNSASGSESSSSDEKGEIDGFEMSELSTSDSSPNSDDELNWSSPVQAGICIVT